MSVLHNDWLGALILLAMFVVTIACAELWTRFKHPDPELPRKFVHIVGGLGCLLFPFLVESPLMVAFMAGVLAAAFAVGQRSKVLQSLSGVGRKSRGSEYYPVAIAFLFYISQGRWWLYFVSVLILTLADAAAALIGGRFGRLRYEVGESDTKSVEGSLMFLGVTFFVTAGLLRLLTNAETEMCLLVAFLVAVLLTGIEAISVHGTDNVFVPLITCYVLLKITTKPVAEVRFQCISMIAIFVVIGVVSRWMRLFSVRDFIIFFTFSYAAWSLGSVDWGTPVFIGFAGFCLVRFLVRDQNQQPIRTEVLLRILIIPLGLLLAANAFDLYQLAFGPYLLAVLLPALMGAWVCLLRAKGSHLWRLLLLSVAGGLALGLGTSISQSNIGWREIVVLPIIGAAIVFVFDRWVRDLLDEDPAVWSGPIWILTLAGVAAGYGLQYFRIIAAWNPRY